MEKTVLFIKSNLRKSICGGHPTSDVNFTTLIELIHTNSFDTIKSLYIITYYDVRVQLQHSTRFLQKGLFD